MLRNCIFLHFFFNDTATTEIYTLSLHDALPICRPIMSIDVVEVVIWRESSVSGGSGAVQMTTSTTSDRKSGSAGMPRPISYAVFCLKKYKHPLRFRREAARYENGEGIHHRQFR